MSHILIRHKVEDFDKWKPVFDGDDSNRRNRGYGDYQLLRNSEDQNEVYILFEVKDLDQAREYLLSDDLRNTMGSAGVTDKPDLIFLDQA